MSQKRPEGAKKGGRYGSFVELVVIIVVALGLAIGIQALLVKPYRIPSLSMAPTLIEGQRVLVNRIGNRFSDPSIGDIVVFHPPSGADAQQCGRVQPDGAACDKETPDRADVNFIKRVVAGPGDRVSIVGGYVIRNGKRASEPFVKLPCGSGQGCDYPTPITVPPDHWYMMGDNRGQSDDSRFWGPVPRKWIIGGAFGTYWPPKRIELF